MYCPECKLNVMTTREVCQIRSSYNQTNSNYQVVEHSNQYQNNKVVTVVENLPDKDNAKYCYNCGVTLSEREGQKFCPLCGSNIE